MKTCPSCSRIYDDTQSFCLDDGTPLVVDSVSHTAETVVMPLKKKKSKLPILFIGILGLLVLGIMSGWFFIQRNFGDSQRTAGNLKTTPEPIQSANNTVTTASSPSTGPADAPQVTIENSAPIATKDIGSLRVVLKSFSPLKLDNGHSGIRVVFGFTNLEKERPIVVAMNANAYEYTGNELGNYLRSTLVDENGGVWRLGNSDVEGMSVVGVGNQHVNGTKYNPAEIVNVLAKRDEIKSDVLQEGGSEFRFVFGSMTEMPPGESKSVTMSFVRDSNQTGSGAPPKIFQLASEIVVGIVTNGAKTSYSLNNLTFDKINLAGRVEASQ